MLRSGQMRARDLVRWLWLPVLAVVGWTAWVLYSRSAENRRIEAEAAEKRVESDSRILRELGSEVRILTFYANPPVLRRGEQGLLCYGAANAKSVRIEPAVEGVSPSLSRCVEVRPGGTTDYTLYAADSAGKTVEQTISVQVR